MKERIKQLLVLPGIIIAIIAGLVWLTNSKNNAPVAAIGGEAKGALTVQKSNYDFGMISMSKGKVSKEFVLENKSANSVLIGEVFTSCMCTEVELKIGNKVAGPFGMQGHGGANKANLIVRAGETLVVEAIFDPAAHGPSGVGPVQRQIMINTNAGENPLVLEFEAIVTP